jgi:hypothetical protein
MPSEPSCYAWAESTRCIILTSPEDNDGLEGFAIIVGTTPGERGAQRYDQHGSPSVWKHGLTKSQRGVRTGSERCGLVFAFHS